jgi:putative membrane protein
MKYWTYVAMLLGLALVTALVLREGFSDVIGVLGQAGWPLLWLVPLHALPMFCDTMAWRVLLKPNDPHDRARMPYLFWVSAVRESVGRLLPMTNLAGDLAGIHLVRHRLATGPVVASVVGEIFMTICNQYVFSAIGIVLLITVTGSLPQVHTMLLGLLFSLPVPILFGLLLRYGAVFKHIENFARSMAGPQLSALIDGEVLDREIRGIFERGWRLILAMGWQLTGFIVGSLETWLALSLLGKPVSISAAIALEAVAVAIRNLIFFIPGSLGVQEAGLILFGQMVGLDSGTALSLSLAKRMREVLYGTPALLSWQWVEARRLRDALHDPQSA